MRPIGIPAHVQEHNQPNAALQLKVEGIRQRFSALLKGEPEVSIVMPAYNEEENILGTLSSLSRTTTNRSVEFVVVNNNSKDRTESIVLSTGVRCITETKQGITHARNAGLSAARGKYILNADADTIYPPEWVEQMVRPLDDEKNAVTYGRFSFIPVAGTPRIVYVIYEYIADLMRYFNKYFREEAVNVYGFNSGFRKAQGDEVEGFNHPPQANEDGWMALKLRNKGFGKLYYVTNIRALVWTTDRRIQMDGGLLKGFLKRIKRVITGKRQSAGPKLT
ncbi:MAG: glycosyltransferase family 2 protein [Gemmatimonadaceae bacterium]|nr:glycosyltransferase family 2 protein [Chitinophagaceae bacterium]